MSTQADTDIIWDSDKGILVLKQTLGSDFLQGLFQFFRNAQTHDVKNQIFQKMLSDITQTANTWIGVPDLGVLQLSIIGEQFFINDIRIRPKPRNIDKLQYLLRYLRNRRILGLSIAEQTTPDRLGKLLWVISHLKRTEGYREVSERLSELGLHEFSIRSIDVLSSSDKPVQSLAKEIYDQLYNFAESYCERLDELIQKEPPALEQLFDSLSIVDPSDLSSLFCLTQIETDRKPLPTIAARATIMLYAWGRNLGLPYGVLAELAGAGLAHAIVLGAQGKGKFDIRDINRLNLAFARLEKLRIVWPISQLQTLSCLEWSIPFGEKGVYEMNGKKSYQHFFSRMVRIAVLYHQTSILEPQLKNEQIVDRLFSPTMSCDQSLVKLFVHWLGLYPLGTFVKLSTGEVGQICSTTTHLTADSRPKVGIYKDTLGALLDRPFIKDLNDPSDENSELYKATISESLPAESIQVPESKVQLLGQAMLVAFSS